MLRRAIRGCHTGTPSILDSQISSRQTPHLVHTTAQHTGELVIHVDFGCTGLRSHLGDQEALRMPCSALFTASFHAFYVHGTAIEALSFTCKGCRPHKPLSASPSSHSPSEPPSLPLGHRRRPLRAPAAHQHRFSRPPAASTSPPAPPASPAAAPPPVNPEGLHDLVHHVDPDKDFIALKDEHAGLKATSKVVGHGDEAHGGASSASYTTPMGFTHALRVVSFIISYYIVLYYICSMIEY